MVAEGWLNDLVPQQGTFSALHESFCIRARTGQKNPCSSGEREDDKRSDRTGPRSSDSKPKVTIWHLYLSGFVLWHFLYDIFTKYIF